MRCREEWQGVVDALVGAVVVLCLLYGGLLIPAARRRVLR